ncbi:MAG: phosphomannose isomerase type II C-terminal cupin domain [Alphaproteobacteria bacterium]|nr:phosphomannose isomerase type II C-terminal cupin domain [Alphaproteobacteria bacterium]
MANSYKELETGERPWGGWQVISIGRNYVIKKVEVNPEHRLSLQYHNHRAEVWAIVSGLGEVVIGEESRQVKSGDCVGIPQGVTHRITNIGEDLLVFIETQNGNILDESDIVRIHDDYQRIK